MARKERRISRPVILWQKIREAWLYNVGYLAAPWRQRRYIRRLAGRERIRVVFVAVNMPMWKYQDLYFMLKADSRFSVSVVLSPSMNFTDGQRQRDIEQMRRSFTESGVDYVDWDIEHGAEPVDIRRSLDPDIVFYAQPYHGVFHPRHQFLNFTDRLLAYNPYGFQQTRDKWLFDQVFCNVAWKLYYVNSCNADDARLYMRNRGRNVVIVGYPDADRYMAAGGADAWKGGEHRRKRLIWAPHFTLANDGSAMSRSNFLAVSGLMLDIARRYADRLRIAFKPHPGLFTELCNHPDWGEQRARDYYKAWETMENTQLETGGFVELFRGSDAMIHDCGSFVVDYLYFGKPVMYLTSDMEKTRSYGNAVCREAYDVHYAGNGDGDIIGFIDNVVLGGDDPLAARRTAFYEKNLRTPGTGSVARNTYNDILESLGMAGQ